MKNLFFALVTICLLSGVALGQTQTNAISGGTGWKRIASSPGGAGRGFGRVTLITIGGDFTPLVLTVEWFHDWSASGGITVRSDSKSSPYWSAARVTNDGSNTYIEVNFTANLNDLAIFSDSYGWRPATPYSGTLPNGGGTVRATANVARLNIENNFIVDLNGRVGIGTASPQARLAVDGDILAIMIEISFLETI